jgi:hypothetical protein
VLAAALAGCGGGDSKPGGGDGLAWEGEPQVFKAANLPDDRVVIARVVNEGDETLHLVAADLTVRDAAGHALDSTAGFTTTFAHGLFGAMVRPKELPATENIRLGKVAYIAPGASLPFYAAWRLDADTKGPLKVDYGKGTLELPDATATAAG